MKAKTDEGSPRSTSVEHLGHEKGSASRHA